MAITRGSMRVTLASAVVFPSVLLLAISPAQAQEFGIKGGGGSVSASAPSDQVSPERFDRGLGFSLGAFMLAPISEHLNVQVEALFSRRTFDLANNPDVPSLAGNTLLFAPIDRRFRADYLEIPTLLRVPLGRGKLSALALVGPALAINLAAELEDRVFPSNSSPDLTAAVRDLDLAMIFGGAVTIGSRFVVEGRYNVGLLSIRSAAAEASAQVPDVKWRSFGLSAGMIF